MGAGKKVEITNFLEIPPLSASASAQPEPAESEAFPTESLLFLFDDNAVDRQNRRVGTH